MRRFQLPWHAWAGLIASAVLAGVYARGGHAWLLGLVMLVPWMLALESRNTVAASLRSGWLMSVAFTAAVFGWFGVAIGAYTGIGAATGVTALLVLAPLLQPQLIAFALVRHWVGRRHSPWLRAIAAASAWVACEWLLPRLFGDSLGHGLYPSLLLRQFADVGGVAGITFLLILVNECIAIAIHRRRERMRAVARPLIVGIAILAVMSGYGALRLSSVRAATRSEGMPLRIGMVQSNLYDYERLRREMGAYDVVRHVLDTHYALSRDAVDQHDVDALLWSETVYPTTFGHPKSEDGAAFDREIRDFVASTGTPLVFGTYDLDDQGEYNAAAFLDPDGELLGFYRKSKLFPLTEYVPRWLDGPVLRRVLPWAGSWQPGDGARVFPLRMRDGREVPVLPLICRDDVDTTLALDGARLGAQLILGMSNDSWFTDHPTGAELHLAVAAFRSIETRIPQVRVTANGISAVIDPTGAVTASAPVGEAALLVGEVLVREPPATLLVAWGDWVGRACFAFLVLLGLLSAAGKWRSRNRHAVLEPNVGSTANTAYRANVAVLTPFWRIVIATLKLVARVALLWLALTWVFGDAAKLTSISGIRMFLALVAAPEFVAWCISRMFSATAFIEADALVLEQRTRRIEIPLRNIVGLHAWRWPLPTAGAWIELSNGQRWSDGIALAKLPALAHALVQAGARPAVAEVKDGRMAAYARLRAMSSPHWLDHHFVKFVLFPLVPALPAFRLHQHIAFGGTFGEYQSYGLKAYLLALVIWWASWAIGLVLFAAVLRIITEAGTLLTLLWQPARAGAARQYLEIGARLLFYVGVPAWWLLRIVGG
ncbi:MAG: apolipoprotein N-acyltransferase [Thermomonas sp.]